MCQITHALQRLRENRMAPHALDVCHKANTAGVMFKAGVVQWKKPLSFVICYVCHRFPAPRQNVSVIGSVPDCSAVCVVWVGGASGVLSE